MTSLACYAVLRQVLVLISENVNIPVNHNPRGTLNPSYEGQRCLPVVCVYLLLVKYICIIENNILYSLQAATI